MQSLTRNRTAFRVDVRQAIRRALQTFARVSLGLIFFVAGLDGFIDVLPHPSKPLPERALLFAGALLKSGYFFPMLKGTESIAGAVLLSNRLVPLAVVIIAPVVVNIFAFHLFLAPDGLALSVILLALEAYLAWTYRHVYRPILATPNVRGARRGPARAARQDAPVPAPSSAG